MCRRPSQHSPVHRDRGFQAVPAIVILSQRPQLYANCNLPIWQALLLLWRGSRGEGRRGTIKAAKRAWNLQNKLGSEPSAACSLWEWFSWGFGVFFSFLFERRPVCSHWQRLGCSRWWEVIYSAVWMLTRAACVEVRGLYDHQPTGLGHRGWTPVGPGGSGNSQCCIELGMTLWY